MAKRKNTGRRRPSGQQQARATPRDATELAAEAETAAEKHDVELTDGEPGDTDEQPDGLDDAVAAAVQARSAFEQIATALEQRNRELEDDVAQAQADRAELETQREQIQGRDEELTIALAEVQTRIEDVERREAEIAAKQAEAEAGFLDRREEILGPIRERIVELTNSWHEQERGLIEEWDKKLTERREELSEELQADRERLRERQQDLDQLDLDLQRQQADLERLRGRLQLDQELLAEDRAELDRALAGLDERVASELARARDDMESEQQRLKQRVAELEASDTTLRRLRSEFDGDPTSAIARVNELETERLALQAELKLRPPATAIDELEGARQELLETRRERDEARRARIDLEGRLGRQTADREASTQLELTNAALSSSIEAYKLEIRELRLQFDQLTAASTAETAFPECRDMDRWSEGKRANATQAPGALDEFIQDLQIRMSHDQQAVDEGRRLNYRLSDLRIFLAGMAMSRLHLLEGVSGTGKTTLPRAFAQAIGAGWKTVEVQAGWRDRQDLLGYYNSFERVYRESECLQWLYRAGLPQFDDVPVFIILDEMNLSHPEQYFADFLSVLENPGSPISLIDRKVPDPPKHMETKAGVQLRLPRNVWFVGTANQDETTFGFAPKTYDRAHVMDLKPDAPAVPGDAPRQRPAISLSGLESEFAKACDRHASEAVAAKRFVAGLEPIFNEKFRVGWGHRMNKHIDRFVPVDIAADGSLGEALDHIVASKLMKKIAGRHSLRRQSLEELAETVEAGWPDPSRAPESTLAAVSDEIHDLTFG
jgi:AAA domain (dynein-related subfamily)